MSQKTSVHFQTNKVKITILSISLLLFQEKSIAQHQTHFFHVVGTVIFVIRLIFYTQKIKRLATFRRKVTHLLNFT